MIRAIALEELTNEEDSFLLRLSRKIQQFICSLHGHDFVLKYEKHRIYQICYSCNKETPGWDV